MEAANLPSREADVAPRPSDRSAYRRMDAG